MSRRTKIILAVVGVFVLLAIIGSTMDEQSGTTQTPTPASTGDPITDAGAALVNNPCVQDWYNGGATEPLDVACPGWDSP